MFTPFLVVFLVVASGFAGGVLALSWFLRSGDPPVAARSELGRAVGLTPDGTHEASGERDGIEVHARWTSVRRSAGGGRRAVQVMRYWAVIDPPLAIGLEIGRPGVLDGFVGELGAGAALATGDAELDGALCCAARDGARAAEVLLDPDVKRALLAGALFEGAIAVSDEHVAAGHDGWAESAETVRAGIDVVHAIASALRAARAPDRAV